MKLWDIYIKNYCESKKRVVMSFGEFSKLEIFENKEIDRKLSEEGIKCVFDYMKEKQDIISIDGTDKYIILYSKLDTWIDKFYKTVCKDSYSLFYSKLYYIFTIK